MPVLLPSLTPAPASRIAYDGTVFMGTGGKFPPGSASWVSPPAPFGPQVREQQDIGRDDATNPNFTVSSAQVGDTILLICANNFYTAADLLTPTGTAVTTWNLRHTMDGGPSDTHVKVWEGTCTTAGGTVVTNWTTAPPDEERYGGVWVFPGEISFDTAASTDADVSATSLVAPSVTPAGADDLLICLFGSISGAINFSGFGTLTPYTERDVNTFCTYIAAREQLFSSSATGTRTITSSASGQWFAVSVLMKTATAGATGAPAEVAAGTGAASDAAASLGANAEQPSATGTAGDATAALGANAEAMVGTGTAYDASVAVTAGAESPSATGTAPDAVAALAVNAEQPTAAGTAFDATVSTTNAANANAEAASATGTAQDAAVSITANAEQPTGTGTAQDAVSAVGVNAGSPTGTGTAFDASVAMGVNAEQPSAAGAAFDVTVSTAAFANAPAEVAAGTGTAYDAPVAVGANAGAPVAAGTAYDATVSTVVATNAPAEVASGTGTAFDASVAVTVAAGLPTATGAAGDALGGIGPLAQAATGTGVSWDASAALAVAAGLASATGTAFDPHASYDLAVVVAGNPAVTGDTTRAGVTGDTARPAVTGDRTPAGVA